jgi:hypothetical protein
VAFVALHGQEHRARFVAILGRGASCAGDRDGDVGKERSHTPGHDSSGFSADNGPRRHIEDLVLDLRGVGHQGAAEPLTRPLGLRQCV